jgi:tetratricopeptide (TPR) repeat protein
MYFELAMYEDAIGCYNEVIEKDPSNSLAWLDKGLVYGHMREDKQALPCFDEALRLDPRNPKAWTAKEMALAKIGNTHKILFNHISLPKGDDTRRIFAEGLLKEFNETVIGKPNDLHAVLNRAILLGHLGLWDEAISGFTAALDLDSECHMAWLNKGLALAEKQRFDDAIFCFGRARDLGEERAAALLERCNAIVLGGRQLPAAVAYPRNDGAVTQQQDIRVSLSDSPDRAPSRRSIWARIRNIF